MIEGPPPVSAGTVAPPLFIGSEIYRGSSYGMRHPLRVPRVSTVMDLARVLGWLPSDRFRISPRAKPAALALWHEPAYVADLGTLSNPIFPEVYRRPATGAGGVMLAAELLAAKPGVIHVPGGGTHHGLPGRANGFCYLNDVVLGIKVLQRAGLSRVARWPFTGLLGDAAGGSAFNLPVPKGYNDSEARAVLHDLILPRVEEFRPQALVVQCGADSLLEDPLSRLSLSNCAYLEALRALLPLAPRVLVLGGGGYNPWSVGRLWTAIWGLVSGQELPDALPGDAQAVLAALGWGGGGRPDPEPQMRTTLLDTSREGPVRPEIRDRLAILARR